MGKTKSLGRAYIQPRQAALSMVWSGACRLVRTDLRTERVWACFLAIFAHARAHDALYLARIAPHASAVTW
jgi:hypothetical protein